jgi:hypothetical protein
MTKMFKHTYLLKVLNAGLVSFSINGGIWLTIFIIWQSYLFCILFLFDCISKVFCLIFYP